MVELVDENRAMVTRADIVDGLQWLGLDKSSAVLVHSSLRSFGHVDGGAEAVCRALVDVCGTVMMPSGSMDSTGIIAPPGLVRPDNAFHNAASWEDFDEKLAAASSYDKNPPVDRWLGIIPDTMRQIFSVVRQKAPLFGFLAFGDQADVLIEAARDDFILGPIDALEKIGGDVLLLGVGHTSNTTIHLAEQRLGSSRFYRYAKVGDGVWAEFPNVSGESHRFDDIEPALAPHTRETMIGECRARRISVADVLEVTTRLITEDPRALLCHDDPECRCAAAYAQRLAARTS